jgi:NADH:ubiquinone oxidoreductase subunit 4 (subunit M)
MANISFPLTSSFIGEFVILMGVMAQSFWIVFFASTSMVLGAVYTLWTYNRIFFGNLSVLSIYSYKDVNAKEISLYVILIFCLFFMGLCSYFFFDFMHVDCLLILERRAA